VLTVNDAKTAELAAKLPSGRVHSNGKGFIPAIRRDVYDQLLEASGKPPEPQSAQTKAQAEQPAAGKHSGKRPENWQQIAAGDIVIIQDDDPKDGWWEAIVVAATADMLNLRWRANPRQRLIARHRLSVGLMYPDVVGGSPATQSSSARTNGHAGKKAEAPAGKSAPSVYPRSWTEIEPDHLVLAREDGPLGQWWEAILVSQQGAETFTLRWRDYPDLPTILRPRQELALLHPSDK
jgi:hypothetical protein